MFGDEDVNLSVDNTNYYAIACEQIPELFLDKVVAKKHFSKFGKIKRFILRPKRLSCTIEYESKEDAEKAYVNAGKFNGINFTVCYAKHEVPHVQNTEEWVDPEVQAELEAMSPGHRLGPILRTSGLQKSNLLMKVPKHPKNITFTPKYIKGATNDRQDASPTEHIKIDETFRSELETILKTPAFSHEEKYRVLDSRDKLIRMTTVRQTDIRKAVATKGTCPDMCPEKERLMREFQRQVSTFEMSDEQGCELQISHKKAVKEYSRSSADQEVPLSHELRSEPVLQMTMLYLVHCIMGLCDDPKTSLGDWFHFLWDRTRSIRKDITQQELCSLGAVQLVEQCARFHIHCAARLVAEDPSVFDKKINAENLTKCLQTLKYMYHDLRVKGVVCPCEGEFRSYVILLNLGDSNFLWEVKQLPEFIQKSVQIKQAIAFYNALQNNNYVRFFSMIKSADTSYLSACILLGYFTKLRVRAMDAIIKSHNWRKNDVYLPLSYLINVLGFDDESSAISFFGHYGLHCDIKNKRVLLDRLIKPDVEYAMDRALQLVESKLHVSVGECVFGQKLPPASLFEDHQPRNSFDSNGMLKTEVITADNQLKKIIGKTESRNQHQELSERDLRSHKEVNLFKIPQTFSSMLPKTLRQQEPTKDQVHKNKLYSFTNEKEKKYLSQGGFKISKNDFEVSIAKKSANESIIEAPISSTISEQPPIILTHGLFQPMTEKPLATIGNIFGSLSTNIQSKSSHIFSTTARETANNFPKQNDISKNSFKKESELQKLQRCSEMKILFNNDLVLNLDPNKTSKEEIESENEKKSNNIQIQEEKEKFDILEGKISSDNQKPMEEREQELMKIKNLQEKAEKTTSLLISQLIEAEISHLASSELLMSQTIVIASDLQKELLISEVVDLCVKDIANEEFALVCHDQLLLSRYFCIWLSHLRKKKKQRKLIENTPLWVTTDTRAQYAQSIEHPCQQKNMQAIKRYRFGQPCDLNKLLKTEWNIMFEENENPLNLFALVGQHLLPKRDFTSCGLLQQRKYFKFLITLPQDKEELLGFESLSNKWLIRSIAKCQIETGPFVHGIEHNVALCVRKLNGIIPKTEDGVNMTIEGDHNDGIVCFITGIEIINHSRKRLYNILKLAKNLKRIPLAIIGYNCSCNKEELAEMLGLNILQEDGLICSYLILGCQTNRKDFSFRKTFIRAVDFITRESYISNSNEIQALAMQNILPFLETSLGEEMWQRWCSSARRNPIFHKICSIPEHVVGIFHKALDHLLHITQEDFEEMPEFPKELKQLVPENSCFNMPLGLQFFPSNWKDKNDKTLIKDFLKSLYLPDIVEKVPVDIEEWKLWLLNYASNCIKDDDHVVTKATHEAITNLVHQVNLQYSQKFENLSSVCIINFFPVFKPIIFARINKTLKDFNKILKNLNVIYLKDDFRNYQMQPWWLNYEPLNQVTIDYGLTPSSFSQTLQKENEINWASTDSINKIIVKAGETSRKAEENISLCKRKKCSINKNAFMNMSSISQLKRTLDDSLYQFELSKKIGQYDTSFVTELTQDIEKSISEVFNHSPTAVKKRKMSSVKSPDRCSDIESVISKATKLICKVESMEDKKFKIKMF